MEIVVLYCETLLTHFYILERLLLIDNKTSCFSSTSTSNHDSRNNPEHDLNNLMITEAIVNIIWVAPRMQTDVKELTVIADLLVTKFGNNHFLHQSPTVDEGSLKFPITKVNKFLQEKLDIQSPPINLINRYINGCFFLIYKFFAIFLIFIVVSF